MADRRLLSRGRWMLGLLAAATLLVSHSGCIVGAGWSLDEIEGIVVDKTTGEPVAGAEVFAVLAKHPGLIPGGHWASFNTRWATSDANGHFYISRVTQPYVEEWFTWGQVHDSTYMYVYRPGYGNRGFTFLIEVDVERIREEAKAKSSLPIVRLEIEPSDPSRPYIRDPHYQPSYMTHEGWVRFCEVSGHVSYCAEIRKREQ